MFWLGYNHMKDSSITFFHRVHPINSVEDAVRIGIGYSETMQLVAVYLVELPCASHFVEQLVINVVEFIFAHLHI